MPPKRPLIPGMSRPEVTSSSATREQIFSIRPLTGASFKHYLRVNLHPSALANLKLKPEGLCYISAVLPEDPNPSGDGKVLPALAYASADVNVSGKVATISESVREALDVGFGTKVRIGQYTGPSGVDATEVEMQEVDTEDGRTAAAGEEWQKEGLGWVYMLENALFDIKYAFDNMLLSGLEYKGVKRSFRVRRIIPDPEAPKYKAKASSSSSSDRIYVLAFKTTSKTRVTLRSHQIAKSSTFGSEAKPAFHMQSPLPPPVQVQPSTPAPAAATFDRIGGLGPQIEKLKSYILSSLRDARIFTALDLTPFRGVLLYGPPGTGKSLIMSAIPGSLTSLSKPISTFQISGSVVGKYLGESEASIRKVFKEAAENQPSVIFIDEIDSLAPKRNSGMESSDGRVVSTLLTELDQLGSGTVIVAATNRPNMLDEALRRPGRLDREIEIPRPDVAAREEILRLMLKKVKKGWISEEVSEAQEDEVSKSSESEEEDEVRNGSKSEAEDEVIKVWASRTHGYVGADLGALVRHGVLSALSRPRDDTLPPAEQVILLESDIEESLKEIRPTAMREILMETPNVRWTDIGGQEEVKQRLREAVEWPLTHPEVYARLGGTPRKGLLLYGPPGCSKTLTAKALATEAGLNFMAVKGPELLNMYVGESERAVREVFRKARAASPSIIFFDEIDALGTSRGEKKGAGGGGGSGVNVLTMLLNEMDGIEALTGVTVLAATNRPDVIDPALMRPGRLDTILYVGPPDLEARREILKIKTRKMAIAPDVDLEELATLTDGYSGAELVNICHEAIHFAMRESFDVEAVGKRHFEDAMTKVVRQITGEMRAFYEGWSVGGVKRI